MPLRRIVISLLVGAATTLAVSWGVAARVPMMISVLKPQKDSWVLKSGERAPYFTWSRPGQQIIKWHWYAIRDDADREAFPVAPPPWWSGIAQRGRYNAPGEPFVNVRVEFASGWPLPAMRYSYWVQDPPGKKIFESSAPGYPLADFTQVPSYSLDRIRALPLRPVLRGFAADTLLYGVAALFGASLVRRAIAYRRRRRNRCTACGYDRRNLSADSGCPECGAAASLRREPHGKNRREE